MWAVLTMLLLGLSPAHGQDLLYRGEAIVPDRSEAARATAFPAALREVLRKQSGLAQLPALDGIDQALARAPGMVLTYSYRTVERQPDMEGLVPGAAAPPLTRELRLVADFLPDPVDAMVTEIGLPRWPAARPPLTAWVVVAEDGERRLLPLEMQSTWDRLAEAAGARGVRLRYPPRPEGGADPAQLQLLWGGFTDTLLATSSGQSVVVAAAAREGQLWNVRLVYDDGRRNARFVAAEPDLGDALVAGIGQVIDEMAARAVIAPDQQGEWTERLVVRGILGADDYRRCRSYLESLPVVGSVGIVAAAPGEVTFNLTINATPRYLDAALDEDGVLQSGGAGGGRVLAQ